jgi:MazG family protein
MQTPPKGPSKSVEDAITRLQILISSLLHPTEGCPWDRAQTYDSISEDFLEETYELREAILAGKREDILEEAGDLLFLIFFLGTLTEKSTLAFGMKEIADAVVDKMVRRHPHLFEDSEKLDSPEDVLKSWHKIKMGEKKTKRGLFASVPTALPALARNYRLCSKAAKAGFDWDSVAQVRLKLDEELQELDSEIEKGDLERNRESLTEELGDVLAVISNLSRHLGISPEKALDAHNRRFISRLDNIASELAKEGRALEDATKDELEDLWQKAKRL